MPSTRSPYKDYELQATGENAGEWGQRINDEVTSKIDSNMSGVTALSLSNSDVELDEDQIENAMLRLTGVLLADITITNAALGFYCVENLTSGSFSVTLSNGFGGDDIVLPQGYRGVVYSTDDGLFACGV